jgi:peptide/nickel transport system ATP-binding protein
VTAAGTSEDGDRFRTDEADRGDGPILAIDGLKKHFPVNEGFISSLTLDRGGLVPLGLDESVVRAVDGVTLELERGETFGVVGESGCGKSTLARTILGLETPTEGTISFRGTDVTELNRNEEAWFRKNVQMVYQDPQSSLNPRRTAGSIVADPLEAAGWDEEERKQRALELLADVGLKREYYNRHPHEFSGGQRQRINLARALSINPDLVVADEPVSGLDMSVQAQILELMNDLQDEYGLTYLVITHDLGVVRNITDRVAVMYVGDFVEVGPTDRLFTDPHHPYTRELLGAVPNPNPDAPPAVSNLVGDVPSPQDPPSGCKFHTRCPEVIRPGAFDRNGYREFAQFRQDLRTGELSSALRSEAVLEEYFSTEPPETVVASIRDAVELADDGNWTAAVEALGPHESECIAETPAPKEVSGPRHHSACHLPVDDRDGFAH